MSSVDSIVDCLGLRQNSKRKFMVSVSGGIDSVSLLKFFTNLRDLYDFELAAFHINFHLRKQDSEKDEEFVRSLCQKWKVPLHVASVFLKASSGIQEAARKKRFEAIRKFDLEWEWVEAHHADDQIETFFFRLLRGSSSSGLQGIPKMSVREGRKVWRPFLDLLRSDIIDFAKKHKLHWREDKSNNRVDYDRNWIRHKLIPSVEQRFPHAKKSILRYVHFLKDDETAFLEAYKIWAHSIVIEDNVEVWDWAELLKLPKAWQARFVHHRLEEKFGVVLSYEKTRELLSFVQNERSFTFNAPRKFLIRGFLKSRQRLRAYIAVIAPQ